MKYPEQGSQNLDGISIEETEEGHSDNTLDYKQSGEVRFKEETDKLNYSVAGADILKPDEDNNHCILTSHTVNTC